jgi:hypothetical protein
VRVACLLESVATSPGDLSVRTSAVPVNTVLLPSLSLLACCAVVCPVNRLLVTQQLLV